MISAMPKILQCHPIGHSDGSGNWFRSRPPAQPRRAWSGTGSMRACAIVAAVTLAGCSDDVVTSRFETLEQARAQRAFERGWLPPVMPESARGIQETNNLDLNVGSGVCSYDIVNERTAYMQRLTDSGASLRTEQSADILTLTTNGSRWEIRLPRSAGWLHWKMTLQR